MKILLSFIDGPNADLEYSSNDELEIFMNNSNLDGLEIVRCGGSEVVKSEKVIGVHLPFFNFWIDYYKGDEKRVIEEFGDLKTAKKFYQYEPEDLYKYFLPDLEYANSNSEYAVFHVADIRNVDYLAQDYHYSDIEVIESSIKLVNKILENSNFDKLLLFENLYFPGLQFNDVSLAKHLLESINHDKVGFMLDIGHLMNTNESIKTEDEGWKYIDRIMDKFESLKEYFKGIHLHTSLGGEFRQMYKNNPPKLSEDFYKRFEEIYHYVSEIDQHNIVKSSLANKVIEKISPEYLVLEFSSTNRNDKEEKLYEQMKILRK